MSLLLANMGILLKDHFTNETHLTMLASLSHYGFLSTFCWLSSMAFEIPCLVVCSSLRTTSPGSDESARFRVYTAMSCGLPALITGLLVWDEYSR